jgi:membrane protein DedA with SNARE-associated domain
MRIPTDGTDLPLVASPLSTITSWALDLVERLGYAGVALAVAMENVFPPIPSEAILPMAGFLVGQGRFSFPAVLIAATIGSVVGALLLYALGYFFGEHKLRVLFRRFGRFALLDEQDLNTAIEWFGRHGTKAVLICRVVPIVRSLISVPAGLVRMSLGTFILYTAIGSGVWNTLLISAGWVLGNEWERVEGYISYIEYATIAGILALVMTYIWKRRNRLFIRA